MERLGLAGLGLILVVIGGLLLGDTLGLLAFDTRRLADYWPLVFVLIGLLVLLEAWAPRRRSDVRTPGIPDPPDADEFQRRLQEQLDRLLPPQPAECSAPAATGQTTDTLRSQPPAYGPQLRPADVVVALLELQVLRRNRLISKREYRSKRSELLARVSSHPV